MKRRGWVVALVGVSISASAWGQGATRLDERKLLELRLPDV